MDKHGQTLEGALAIAQKRFDTTAIRSGPPDHAQVLRLHTAGSANRAHLEQNGAGQLSLYFRGLRYGVDDYVPNSLLGGQSMPPSVTAGEFVCRQMLGDYGYDEDQWPALARQFLIKHRDCRPDRSESNR
jgi:hypothetical protein